MERLLRSGGSGRSRVGGIVIGSALGGAVASAWGVTAPFWFAFVGSAIILVFIWRSLLHIAHTDENLRADVSAIRNAAD